MSNFYSNMVFTPFNFVEIYEIGKNLEIVAPATLADALKAKAQEDGVFVGAYVLVRGGASDNAKYDQSVWMKAWDGGGLYYKQIADLNLPADQWSEFYDDAVKVWDDLEQEVNDAVAAAAALPIGKGTGENAVAQTGNTASGLNSFAEGARTQATADYAHAEGDNTEASGSSSHAGGQYSAATAPATFAHGVGVMASQPAQAVFGKYNSEDENAAFVIGNGNKNEATGVVAPSNLFVVKNNGDIISNGVLLATVKDLFEKQPYVTLEKERRVMNAEEIEDNKDVKELIFSILKVRCHNLNSDHNYKLHLLTLARSKKENNGWYHPNNEGLVNDPDLKNREDKVAYDQLPPLGYINLVKHSHGSNRNLKYPERDEDSEIPSYCVTEWVVDKETGIVEIPLNEFMVPLLKPSYNKSESEWNWTDCKLIGVKASYRAPLLFRFVLIDTTTQQRYDTHSDFNILRLGINRNRIGKNLVDNAGVSIQQPYEFQDNNQNTVTLTDHYVDNKNLYVSII